MDNPFFTVIIPTYNRTHMIKRSVESVLSQTYPSWELIIVDDGSTDNTAQVIQSFNEPRIRYIYQPNQERSAARNTGIRNAKGQYVCFLDSDDYYLPNHLESFRRKIEAEKFPVALFYCDTIEDTNGRLKKVATPVVKARNNVEWVAQTSLGAPRTCTHRSILVKHRFNPAITVGEDVDLWVRVLKEFSLIHNNDCTVAFVAHSGRTVDISSESGFKGHLALIEKIISEDAGGYLSTEVRQRILVNAWFRMGQHNVFSGKTRKAFFAFLRSLSIDPKTRSKEKFYVMMQQFFPTRIFLSLWKRNQL